MDARAPRDADPRLRRAKMACRRRARRSGLTRDIPVLPENWMPVKTRSVWASVKSRAGRPREVSACASSRASAVAKAADWDAAQKLSTYPAAT
eukprot:5547445-Pyramimonas_sp.AAC.1